MSEHDDIDTGDDAPDEDELDWRAWLAALPGLLSPQALMAFMERAGEWRAWVDAVSRLGSTARSLGARMREVFDADAGGQELAALIEEGLLELRKTLRDALDVTPDAVEWLQMVRVVDDALEHLKADGAGRRHLEAALQGVERGLQRALSSWLDAIFASPGSVDLERATRRMERVQRVLQKIIDDVLLPRLLERSATQNE